MRFISQGFKNKQSVAEKKVQDLSRLQGFFGYKKYVAKLKYDKGYFKNRWVLSWFKGGRFVGWFDFQGSIDNWVRKGFCFWRVSWFDRLL